MNYVFFGSPDFAAKYLEGILDIPNATCIGVFTQPDKKVGRKQILTPTPVKLLAQEKNIPVFDSTDIKDLRSKIEDLKPDLAILYAYGKILPQEVLDLPKHGFINVHPSLLPKYRGVAPIAYVLLMGNKETGVSLMKITEKMDGGPIIAQKTYTIRPEDNQQTLEEKLTDLAVNLTLKTLPVIQQESWINQNDEKATYTTFLHKNNGFVPFDIVKKLVKHEELSNSDIPPVISEYCAKNNIPLSDLTSQISDLYYNLYRALYPWPGIWTLVMVNGEQKRLKITEMKPGTISKVQLEGKNEVDFKTFNEAYKLF